MPVMQSRYSQDEINNLPERYSTGQFSSGIVKKTGSDMLAAMTVMKKAQEIYSLLPEFDCGACGSPTCTAFADDVARGNAVLSDCLMLSRKQSQSQSENIQNQGEKQ